MIFIFCFFKIGLGGLMVICFLVVIFDFVVIFIFIGGVGGGEGVIFDIKLVSEGDIFFSDFVGEGDDEVFEGGF